MRTPTPRLSALLTAGVVAATVVLTAPAAHALPVFTVAEVNALGDVENESGALHPCTLGDHGTSQSSGLLVAENGPATTASVAGSGTFTSDDDPSDVITVAANLDAASAVTSSEGNPRTLDITGTGNVAVSTTKGTSRCRPAAFSQVELGFAFDVRQGGFLTVTTTTSTNAVVNAFVVDPGSDDGYLNIHGEGPNFEGSLTVYLPPGRHRGSFAVGARVGSSIAVTPTPVRASVHGEFTVAGSQLVASQGKGTKYVTLPSGRLCATHALTPSVTGKRKVAKKVKQVRFFVNDVLVKKLRKPERGVPVTLPVADDVRADVRSEVTLFPKHKGRPAKALATTATYEACS